MTIAPTIDRSGRRFGGPRFFATNADEPRSRRVSDVTALVASVTGLMLISTSAVPPPGVARAVEQLVVAVPDLLAAVWQVSADLIVVLALVLVATAVVRRRFSVVRDAVVAGGMALALSLAVGRIVTGSWPDAWAALRVAAPPPWYPALRVAVPAAVVFTISPHVTVPVRRVGRWMAALVTFGVTALGAATPLGALAGLLLAVAVSAAVHLLFGSSAGRPSLGLVRGSLGELGVVASHLEPADRQESGRFAVGGEDAHGRPILVNVYGRDAHDAAVLSTLWRAVWFREQGGPLRIGRLRQVEHEALVTLMAAQAGVLTDAVVTAGATDQDDALLVLRTTGVALDPGATDETVVAGIWRAVGLLHAAGIAHRSVDARHVVIGDDRTVGLRDFSASTLATGAGLRAVDQAQALVAGVLLVGPGRAIAVARSAVGDEVLATVLPMLQRPVLTRDQQRAVASGRVDLVALRTGVAETIGSEVPELIELRRVTLGSIVRVALPAIAVIALISLVTGLDLAELGTLLRDASWWLLALGLVVAQLPRITQAVSTLGAAPVRLPLGPVYALQLALSYINLAVPSAAGRIAVNIRFFQRHGMAPGTAVAAGALDGVAGFVMQTALLVGLLAFSSASLDLDLGAAVDRVGWLLVIVAVIVVLAVGVVLVLARLRRFVLRWVRRLAGEAVVAVRDLRSPRRLLLLFGGSLATEVLFALALGTFVAAFGHSVGLGELLLTNIGVGLLSGLLPVPGGIGVAEGGLTIGLVQAGVPDEVAVVAVLTYRLATFYLPPLWGFLAMGWLERRDHL